MILRSFHRALLIAFLLGGLCTLPGCGGGVTEAGNPSLTTNPGGGPIDPQTSPTQSAQDVLDAICNKLAACHPATVTVGICESQIKATSTIDTEIGLASGFGTYAQILAAEQDGTIQPDLAAASQCVGEIQNLSCGSSSAQAAYSASVPNDYSNAYLLLPTSAQSCAGIF